MGRYPYIYKALVMDTKGSNNIDFEYISRHISNKRNPVAVVINTGDANGYGVVANLGQCGVPVISVGSDPENITFSSRYAVKLLCPDPKDSEESFIDFIISLGKGLQPKPVLFITGDDHLLTLLAHEDILEEYYHIPHSSNDHARLLVNKIQFYKELKRYDIPHAETYFPKSASDIGLISGSLDYPYILKPENSQTFSKRFGNKCLEIENDRQLAEIFQSVSETETNLILQKRIGGTERYLVYAYLSKESEPIGICCYKKVRINPIDFGNACVCISTHNDLAMDMFTRFLKKIGYYGLAEAEVQLDKNDGEYKLVEINARSTTESRLPAKCGVNIEYMAYKDVLGIPQNKVVNYQLGVLWIDLIRDVLSVFLPNGYLSQNKLSIREWLGSFKGKRVFAYFSLRDPVPSMILMTRFIREYVFRKKRLYQLKSAISSSIGRRKSSQI